MKDRLTLRRNDPVRMGLLVHLLSRHSSLIDYDKGRVTVEAGRDALGLKELVGGTDPIVE